MPELFAWLGAIAAAIAIIRGVVGVVRWGRQRTPSADVRARELREANEDLEVELGRILRAEVAAYQAIDEDLNARNVLFSGMRGTRHVDAAEEHDRQREAAVREWRRRIEGSGAEVPELPASARTFPTDFEREGRSIRRMPDPPHEPVLCGWCGRLTYRADGAYWCPQHEYEIS